MSKVFRPYEPEQMLLMPTALQEWLRPDHLVYFISDVVLGPVLPLAKAIMSQKSTEVRIFPCLGDRIAVWNRKPLVSLTLILSHSSVLCAVSPGSGCEISEPDRYKIART